MKQNVRTPESGYAPDRDETNEIDLKDILRFVWKKRKFILITTAIFFVLGIFIAFTTPVQYSAQSTILPQSGRQSSQANMGGLASIVGVNLGTSIMSEGNISTSMYPQIINSYPFIREIMEVPIVVEKSNGKEITLYEYYSNSEYREVNLLSVVKKYTIGLPRTIISAFKSKPSTQLIADKNAESDSTGIIKISRQEQNVFDAIKGAVTYEYNSRQGVIHLGYTFSEPLAAAQVSEQLHRSLEKYVINYKTERVQDNLSFVEQSYAEARNDFLKKQADLAAFQDANRGLVTASGRATETRLRSEFDISFTIYNELARQLEQAKLSVKEEKPVLTVINPVIVPLGKSAPSRSRIIIISTILGVILSTIWVLIKPFIMGIIREENYV